MLQLKMTFREKINQQQITWKITETNSYSLFPHPFYGQPFGPKKGSETLMTAGCIFYKSLLRTAVHSHRLGGLMSKAEVRVTRTGMFLSFRIHPHPLHQKHREEQHQGERAWKGPVVKTQALVSREGAAAMGNCLCKRCSSQERGAAVAQSRTC